MNQEDVNELVARGNAAMGRKSGHEIWRLYYRDRDHGSCLEWYGSEREAAQALRIKRDADPDLASHISKVEIPTSRKGLVRWLNQNFDTDNG